MSEHSPGPWRLVEGRTGVVRDCNDEAVLMTMAIDNSDAAFVVHAVNNFKPLLAASKQGLIGLRELTEKDGVELSLYREMREQLKTAIANATGDAH